MEDKSENPANARTMQLLALLGLVTVGGIITAYFKPAPRVQTINKDAKRHSIVKEATPSADPRTPDASAASSGASGSRPSSASSTSTKSMTKNAKKLRKKRERQRKQRQEASSKREKLHDSVSVCLHTVCVIHPLCCAG